MQKSIEFHLPHLKIPQLSSQYWALCLFKEPWSYLMPLAYVIFNFSCKPLNHLWYINLEFKVVRCFWHLLLILFVCRLFQAPELSHIFMNVSVFFMTDLIWNTQKKDDTLLSFSVNSRLILCLSGRKAPWESPGSSPGVP